MLLDRLIQAVHKVFEPRILELKAFKVLTEALLDDFSAQESIHCLDPASAFLVRYLVKSVFCVTRIVDIDLNGVSCRSQICIKTCAREVEKQKFGVKVAFLKACRLTHTRDRAEVGEALLEPEIIPPVHGREVSKPHMCQFVQMNVIVRPFLNIGLLICWSENTISESDSPDVLHGANPELRHVDHVILCEREPLVEEILVEVNAFTNHAEHLSRVKIVELALRYKDSHWRLSFRVFVYNHSIVTCANIVDVGADRRAPLEVPEESHFWAIPVAKIAV